MRDQTCAALWAAVANALRTPGTLVNRKYAIRWGLGSLLLALLVYQGLSSWMTRGFETGSDSETSSILVASRYIPAFSPVSARLISVRDFPRGFAPPGALHTAAEIADSKGQPLFISAVALPEGQPLTRTVLLEIGKNHGLASLLAPGKVAISFALDKERGVGHWIQPGDTLAIFHTPGMEMLGKTPLHTHLLFPAVTVLAVDKTKMGHPDRPEENKDTPASLMESSLEENGSVLTVLLTVAQASTLVEAKEHGRLTAALCAVGDNATEDRHGK